MPNGLFKAKILERSFVSEVTGEKEFNSLVSIVFAHTTKALAGVLTYATGLDH